MIKELYKKRMIDKNHFSRNIEAYMRYAIEMSDSIYFYRIDPMSVNEEYDKLLWMREVEHEEYDKIKIANEKGEEVYYQSEDEKDKVIKLDLTNQNIRAVFDKKFRIGTCWARGDSACKIGEGDNLFDDDPGYEYYNFVLTKNNEVILDAWLHGGFDIGISMDIVKRNR